MPPSLNSVKYLNKYPSKRYKNSKFYLKKGIPSCGPSQDLNDIKKVIDIINKY